MASEVCRRSEPQPAVGQFNTESGPSKCRLLPLNVRGNAGPSGGTLGPPLGLALTGMRRDFPHSCNGVDAPRLVVFEVINLKHWKGEVRGTDYTRCSPRCCSSRRGRSGQARDPGSARRQRRACGVTNRRLDARQVHRLVRPTARRLHRRHGDQLQCAPLGAQADGVGPGRTLIAAQLVSPYRKQGASGKNDANDAAAICEAAGRPQHAFRAREVHRAAKHAVRAPPARRLQGRAHRMRQPHPRLVGRVRVGLRQEPRRARARAGRRAGRRQQRDERAGAAGAAARPRPVARTRRRIWPGATSASPRMPKTTTR